MAIIGEEIEDYVSSQINARQILHGSGAGQDLSNARNDFQINLLNSNTSWIKLASGVSVSSSKLDEIGVPTSLANMELAKKYILFAGFSKLEDGKLVQREGFLPQKPDSSYTYGSYGYSPMPGITNADIKTLNRGSIKKATVQIKINNKQQFDIIDLLYLRLGYTVLLEWGNSIYTPDGEKRSTINNTLIDNPKWFFNPSFGGSRSYRDILGPIESHRKKYNGNYDALLGKVSNFDWTFNPDGTYDATITIISLGDVIESLKLNISTDKDFNKFLEASNSNVSTSTTTTQTTDIIEDNKDANAISSMLWAWKFVNRNSLQYSSYDESLYIRPAKGTDEFVGAFLKTLDSNSTTIQNTIQTVEFRYEAYRISGIDGSPRPLSEIDPDIASDDKYQPKIREIQKDNSKNERKRIKKELLDALGKDQKIAIIQIYPNNGVNITEYQVKIIAKVIATKKISTDSPITDFGETDACWLVTDPTQYYLRLGALLNYIAEKMIPRVDIKATSYSGNPPIFEIDQDEESNLIYSLPNQISLDPRVCIVRNDKFQRKSGEAKVYSNLEPFRTEDNGDPNPNTAYLMNVYLNFESIIESLNSSADERGDVNVFNFLKSICDGLNKSLGGINNIEPIIDEESNTLRLIDTTPIPKVTNPTSKYTLQLYGYDKTNTGYASNFIRDVKLKTAITPEYATMITVGATAGGYVKGTEATAFSRWNEGLIDRFKEKFTPGDENSLPEGGEDEALINYTTKMLDDPKFTSCYGFSGNLKGGNNKYLKISTDAIENNLSVGTEYFKYLISSQTNQQGGTVGFIPFKIGFTMDGLSGIKIYNKLNIDTRFLPRAYGNTLDLIVTGVSHKLANSDWETEIEATVIPKTSELKNSVITSNIVAGNIQSVNKGKKGKDIPPKDPNKLCGLANINNVNIIYPQSIKWRGNAPLVVTPTKSPSVTINLKNVPQVPAKRTTYTSKQVIDGAKIALNRMAPNTSDKYKRLIITAALAIAIKEQSLKGYNNNLTGVEASGFKLFTKDEVVGKILLPEGQGTGKQKEYYAFKDLSSGLVPVISKILERNIFATGGTANEFAWRYFRDWNGYGARTTEQYSLPTNQKSKSGIPGYDFDDCKIISGIESTYNKAVADIRQYY